MLVHLNEIIECVNFEDINETGGTHQGSQVTQQQI
jgi:hypothetical protein